MTETLPEGTLTVLFTDVEGATGVMTSQGEPAGQELLRDHEEIVRASLLRHAGHEIRSTGDGFLLLFPSARRAVMCALDIQRNLVARNRRQLGAPLNVRIGMNAGEVTREGADIFGAAVNAAARIAARAKGGQILVSEVVKQLTGTVPDVTFESRGRAALKGFPDRWHLYEVVAKAAVQGRPEAAPMVGREREKTELLRHLEQALAGRGEVVFVSGEPGVGKTRLGTELAAAAGQHGVAILTGRCPEMEGAVSFAPFVEIFENAIEAPEARAPWRLALGDDASQVARMVPGLRRVFPDLPDPVDLPVDQERYQLFNSVTQSLLSAAESRPLLLVLEDLHNADEPTLLLLEHLAQRIERSRIMILGTHRDIDRDPGAPLQGSLERLVRRRLLTRLHLRPLDEAGVRELLGAMAQKDPPQELVSELHRDTEGNPFFVEEVFKHLAEEGRLFDDGGNFIKTLGNGELDVPGSVRLVVGRRLQHLSDDCRLVLSVASVVGRAFPYKLLESIAGVDPDNLLDALDEAENVAMIGSTSDGIGVRFSFDHELTRQTLLSEMSTARRQQVHLKVAESLEQQYSAAPDAHAAEIAHHLTQAGDLAEAEATARYLLMAGRAALRALAFEEALTYFGRVDPDRLPVPERADILRLRGLAQRSLGHWDDAIALWEQALDLYEAAGDVQAAARMCRMMSNQVAWAMRYREALDMAERGLSLVGPEPSLERCRLLSAMASSLSMMGDHDRSAVTTDEAAALARKLDDLRARGYAANAQALHHLAYDEYETVVELSVAAAEDLRRAGDERGQAQLLGFAQAARFYLGRFNEAERMALEVVPLLRRIGNVGQVLLSGRVQAAIAFGREPNLEAYMAFAVEDLEICRSTGTRLIADSHTFIGTARFWSGDWEGAQAAYEEGLAEQADSTLTGNAIYVALGAAYLGDVGRMQEVIERERPSFPRGGEPASRRSWTVLLGAVEALLVGGDREQAAALYPLVQEALEKGQCFRFYDYRLVRTLAGMAAAAAARWTEAEEHFKVALEEADRLPLQLERAEALRVYGSLLRGRGEGLKAQPFLDQARAAYSAIGMPRHVDMTA